MNPHNLIAVHGGTAAFVVSQSEEGYVVRIPSEGNRVTKCFASDVFRVREKPSLDLAKKEILLGKAFVPSGNNEEDIRALKEYYSVFTAKHPEKY